MGVPIVVPKIILVSVGTIVFLGAFFLLYVFLSNRDRAGLTILGAVVAFVVTLLLSVIFLLCGFGLA